MSRYDQIVERSMVDVIVEVEKFNPYHGPDGRFTSPGAATSFTYKPGAGKMYDLAIRRERERQAAMGGPKEGLVKGLGEKHAQAIEDAVQKNAPEEVKALWQKYGNDVFVDDGHYQGRAKCKQGNIYVNIEKDANSNREGPYATTMHESGHSIDHRLSRIGMAEGKGDWRFSNDWNDGAFEKLLNSEAGDYFKAKQKAYAAESGGKVSIDETRKRVAREFRANGGFEKYGDVSDMLEGATKGKFRGVAGHGKTYWTGTTTYYYKIEGHKVSTEAFAEMFSAASLGRKSLEGIKEVFPKSYDTFLRMCADAAK